MDSKPTAARLSFGRKRHEPLHLMVKRMIREQAAAYAMEQGFETPAEADDFDVDDDFDIKTPYEHDFDTQPSDTAVENDPVAKKVLEKANSNEGDQNVEQEGNSEESN